MKQRIVDRVDISKHNALRLRIVGSEDEVFQYVYRAGDGVHWDAETGSFSSTPMTGERSTPEWFQAILDCVKGELDIELRLAVDVIWDGIAPNDIEIIQDSLRR